MYICNGDIDQIIISYILNGSEKWNLQMIKRLYIIFGRSQYKNFIINAKKYFFDTLFTKHEVNTINDLLSILIDVKNPHFYKEHIKFRRSLGDACINFGCLSKKTSYIVRYLALYNDYIWICIERWQSECVGYQYSKIHNDTRYKDKPLTYKFLKSKRVHNLEYYDLIHKADNIYESTYKLKENVWIGKTSATKDYINIVCIKL